MTTSAAKDNRPGFRQPPKHRPQPRRPALVFQPQTYQALLAGVDAITNTIAPTLGPLPRVVAMERLKRTDAAELLDDGATIARRMIEIAPRSHDVGAMLLRQALWRMRDEAGDGTTTMAVMYRALLREGIRAVVQFECNAMRLRAGLEKGLRAVQAELQRHSRPLTGRQQLTRMAEGMCQGQNQLAELLGEIFDLVGPDGLVVVEGGHAVAPEREYIEGTYWKLSGWFSRHFLTDPADKRIVFEDAALLISDLDLREPDQIIPVLEQCMRAGAKRLFIVARDISDRVIGLLINNTRANTIQAVAVRTPKLLEMDRAAVIEDMALLTGGRPFYSAAYNTFEGFRTEDLGQARRVWATDNLLGLYGGKGDPRAMRRHMASLRGQLRLAEGDHARTNLQTRLGQLSGGTVILRVGGTHEIEREARKVLAERAIVSLRHAACGGVVAGGGLALLRAQAVLHELEADTPEAAHAFQILARALEAPARVIAHNAGHVPDVVIENIRAAPCEMGFDAHSGRLNNLRDAGIVDATLVLQKAVEMAVSGAAMALTTDVIVHHRKPVESVEP